MIKHHEISLYAVQFAPFETHTMTGTLHTPTVTSPYYFYVLRSYRLVIRVTQWLPGGPKTHFRVRDEELYATHIKHLAATAPADGATNFVSRVFLDELVAPFKKTRRAEYYTKLAAVPERIRQLEVFRISSGALYSTLHPPTERRPYFMYFVMSGETPIRAIMWKDVTELRHACLQPSLTLPSQVRTHIRNTSDTGIPYTHQNLEQMQALLAKTKD